MPAERLAVELRHSPDLIVDECTALDCRRFPCRASGQGTHPSLEFSQVEGLDHIVVCPQIEALDAITGPVERRQNQHRQGRVTCTQTLQNLEPHQLGQAQIKDQQVIVDSQQRRLGINPVRRPVDRIATLAKRAGKAISDNGIVFSKKDSHLTLNVHTGVRLL